MLLDNVDHLSIQRGVKGELTIAVSHGHEGTRGMNVEADNSTSGVPRVQTGLLPYVPNLFFRVSHGVNYFIPRWLIYTYNAGRKGRVLATFYLLARR